MSKGKSILMLLLALVLSVGAWAQGDKHRVGAKPQLYVFSAQWCSPCQRMHKEAFADAEVMALKHGMECFVVDVDTTPGGRDLYRKHARTGGVPELVLYDKTGKFIARQSGYETIELLVAFLRKAYSQEELKQIAAQRQMWQQRYVYEEEEEN